MARVPNLNNTGDRNPPSGYKTWKEWWESRTKRSFSKCSHVRCVNRATLGAHVQKESLSDRAWYKYIR